uniref:Uncharacterized protein n=1 Tax=Anguilla anguilla TaxID=7936 RepID=A0A0E9WNZ3_ANGAN
MTMRHLIIRLHFSLEMYTHTGIACVYCSDKITTLFSLRRASAMRSAQLQLQISLKYYVSSCNAFLHSTMFLYKGKGNLSRKRKKERKSGYRFRGKKETDTSLAPLYSKSGTTHAKRRRNSKNSSSP